MKLWEEWERIQRGRAELEGQLRGVSFKLAELHYQLRLLAAKL